MVVLVLVFFSFIQIALGHAVHVIVHYNRSFDKYAQENLDSFQKSGKISKFILFCTEHISSYSRNLLLLFGRGNIFQTDLSFSEQLLKGIFSTFCGQKKVLKFFKKYCSVRTKKLHKIKLKRNFKRFLKK